MPDASFPPPLACDCHTHVIGPKGDYPLAGERPYTPGDATLGELEAMLAGIGVSRVVIVQPSIYGADNRCTLDATVKLGDRARAVVVPAETADGASLDAMHRAGARGVRINLASIGLRDPAEARRRIAVAVGQCERNGWHLQLFTEPATIEALAADLKGLPVPVVVDHFGLLSPAERGTAGERVLCDLLSSGKAWVKLSGTDRLKPEGLEAETADLARRLFAANPQQAVWGSDWPHTPAHPGGSLPIEAELPNRAMDDGALVGLVARWFADETEQRAVLVDNPARLYDF